MFLYFKVGETNPSVYSNNEQVGENWYNVPDFQDINTQLATRDIISDVITVTDETRGERANRRQDGFIAQEPQFSALKVMVEQNQSDLEPRVEMLEKINESLTQ